MATATMKNVLASLPFYRKKSIMILDLANTIAYGVCTPMMSLKFAPRADEKSKGQWDDESIYYFPSFTAVFDFATRLKSIVANPEKSDTNFSNPAKQKGVFVAKSIADNSKVYIMFSFYIGPKDDQKKVNVSLSVEEANSIIALLMSYVSGYSLIAQTALLRNDTWFNLYGKNKEGGDAGEKSSGGYNKSTPQQKPTPQQKAPDPVNESMIHEVEKEFGFGGGQDFGDEVPF